MFLKSSNKFIGILEVIKLIELFRFFLTVVKFCTSNGMNSDGYFLQIHCIITRFYLSEHSSGTKPSNILKFSNSKPKNILRIFLIFGENNNVSCFFQDFLRKWLFVACNVLNTFLTFEPL